MFVVPLSIYIERVSVESLYTDLGSPGIHLRLWTADQSSSLFFLVVHMSPV